MVLCHHDKYGEAGHVDKTGQYHEPGNR